MLLIRYVTEVKQNRIVMSQSFFTTEDGVFFKPTDYCRGPWHAEHCHAGPPSGLAARAMERLSAEQRLVRLTINLIRPVPLSGFRVQAQLTRKGRSVSTAEGIFIDTEGVERATFTGLLMTAMPPMELPTQHQDIGLPENAKAGGFAIEQTVHGKRCFVDATQMKYPDDENPDPGPTKCWMKTLPLLDNEVPSPFQRICPLADCGNAFGRNADPWDSATFANADLTVALHREPQGEWLGSHAHGYWEPDGIGLADAQLFDRHGAVGHALQTLVLRPFAQP